LVSQLRKHLINRGGGRKKEKRDISITCEKSEGTASAAERERTLCP